MTNNTLNAAHPTHNPQCDGAHCTCSDSVVRIIRLDDSANAHLCPDCYEVECREGGLPPYQYDIFPSLSPEKAMEWTT